MKGRGFTLIEMLVVVVVLVTLMTVVFKITGVGGAAEARARTIMRMQRLENCLSGYNAAFGCYPPVKLHGARDIYLAVGRHGIQTETRNESIWGWNRIGEEAERRAWAQVQAACRSQPVACQFPFPDGWSELIVSISDEMKERASSGADEFSQYWDDPYLREQLMAGFDDGGSGTGTGRFDGLKGETDWRKLQLFQFGVMSYLLPRYLVMMNGNPSFYTGEFAQWENNNTLPSDPFSGRRHSNWSNVRRYSEGRNKTDLARIANIPSQAVCARWMPNLEGVCSTSHDFTLFGISIRDASDDQTLSVERPKALSIYSPGEDDGGTSDQYILDKVTLKDGWGNDFYYYSPSPHQGYTLWSAGPNGRTFPPWISREDLSGSANERVAKWVVDDIVQLSN